MPKKNLHDTVFAETSWKEFIKIIKNYGFEIIVRRKFKYTSAYYGKKPVYPEFVIAAHRTKYLLLCATSWIFGKNEQINGGTVYGTLGIINEKVRNALIGCSHGPGPSGREFDIDISDGFISKLEKLGRVSRFVKWNNPDRFLWLMDYVQEKRGEKEKRDEKAWQHHRDEYLRSAPKWVRDFIFPN